MNDNILTSESTDTEWCSNRAIYKLLSKTNIPYYNITCAVTHGASYGSAIILKDGIATLLISSDDGYAVTPNKEDIVVTNAEIASYEILDIMGGNRVCRLTLKNPIGDITVNFPCFKIFKINLKLYGCTFKGPNIILDTKEVRATINIKDTEYIKKKFEVTGATWNYDDNTHILTLSAASTDVAVDIEYDYRDIEDIQVLIDLFPQVAQKDEDYPVDRKIFDDNTFHLHFRYSYGCFDVLHIHRVTSHVDMHITPTSRNCQRPDNWDTLEYRDCIIYNIAVFPAGPWARRATGWDDMGGGGAIPRSMRLVSDEMADNFKSNFNDNIQPYFQLLSCTHHSSEYTRPDINQYINKTFKCRTSGKYFTFTYDEINTGDSRNSSLFVQWMHDFLFNKHLDYYAVQDITPPIIVPVYSVISCGYKEEHYKLKKNN